MPAPSDAPQDGALPYDPRDWESRLAEARAKRQEVLRARGASPPTTKPLPHPADRLPAKPGDRPQGLSAPVQDLTDAPTGPNTATGSVKNGAPPSSSAGGPTGTLPLDRLAGALGAQRRRPKTAAAPPAKPAPAPVAQRPQPHSRPQGHSPGRGWRIATILCLICGLSAGIAIGLRLAPGTSPVTPVSATGAQPGTPDTTALSIANAAMDRPIVPLPNETVSIPSTTDDGIAPPRPSAAAAPSDSGENSPSTANSTPTQTATPDASLSFPVAVPRLPAAPAPAEPPGQTQRTPSDPAPILLIQGTDPLLGTIAPPADTPAPRSLPLAPAVPDTASPDLPPVLSKTPMPRPADPTPTSQGAAVLSSPAGTSVDMPAASDPALVGKRAVIHVPSVTPPDRITTLIQQLGTAGLSDWRQAPVNITIGETHLRYYHDSDAEAARILAERLDIQARDFTTFRPGPESGLLEIWVAGSGGGQRTGSSQNNGSDLGQSLREATRGIRSLFDRIPPSENTISTDTDN